jgi:hypothetical protein
MYEKLNLQVKKRTNQLFNAIRKKHKKTYGEKRQNSLLNYILIAVTLKKPTHKNISKLNQHLKNCDKNTRSNFVAYFEHFYRKYKNYGAPIVKIARDKLRNYFCNKIIKRNTVELKTQKRLDKTINLFQINNENKEKIERKKVKKLKKRGGGIKIKKFITGYKKKKLEYLELINKKKETEVEKIEKKDREQKTKIVLIRQINFKLRNSKGFRWRKKYKYRSQQNIYNFKENNFKFDLLGNIVEKYKNTKESNNSFENNKKQKHLFVKNKQQQFNVQNPNKTLGKNFKITKKQHQPGNLEEKIFKFNPNKQNKIKKATFLLKKDFTPSKSLGENTERKNGKLKTTANQSKTLKLKKNNILNKTLPKFEPKNKNK